MGDLRTCDVCKSGVGPPSRYMLRRYHPQNRRRIPGVKVERTFESAGSIDLCDPCWERIAKPRTRPNGNYPSRKGMKGWLSNGGEQGERADKGRPGGPSDQAAGSSRAAGLRAP